MSKPKLNQPDVEQSTTLEPNIKILTTFNSSDKPETINMNITIPSKMFENVFVTGTSIQSNPTLEEVKKEWEDDDWTWEEDEVFITIYKEDPLDNNVVKEILINKSIKTYECYDASDYEETSLSLTLEEHIRLTKTFRAKGWEV